MRIENIPSSFKHSEFIHTVKIEISRRKWLLLSKGQVNKTGKSDQTVQITLDLCFTLKLHLQFTDTILGYCLSY